MPDRITLTINGSAFSVEQGTSVAAAIMIAGAHCRTSVSGEPRGPLCGMGICFECRAMVNGTPHSRTCQMLCDQGMEVVSQ
jgi:sarcosine oxidase subunit alpha